MHTKIAKIMIFMPYDESFYIRELVKMLLAHTDCIMSCYTDTSTFEVVVSCICTIILTHLIILLVKSLNLKL